MKKNDLAWRTHLPKAAVAMLLAMKPADAKPTDYVFHGDAGPTVPVAHDALDKELKSVRCFDTLHGSSRSGLATWIQDHRTADFMLGEFQLHHVSGTGVVAAYCRSDLLEQRRAIIDAWAAHLTQDVVSGRAEDQNVVALRAIA